MDKTAKDILKSIEEKEASYTALITRYENEEKEEKELLELLNEFGY